MATIKEIGEFPLIDRLKEIIFVDRPDIIVGIGDDVAVLANQGDHYLLATVDAQVENAHFLRDRITPVQLGQRALAINLSDIAAMGGKPEFALVSLGLPIDTEVDWIEEVYRGLRSEGDRYGVAIVGGNMARSPSGVWLDVTVLGYAHREHILLRSGAHPGDQVVVTGLLGDSAAGLKLVLNPNLSIDESERAYLLTRFLVPIPRLPESAVIAESRQATAMLDISDGLSSDVGHICERSQVGVRIWADRLPMSSGARRVADLTTTPFWQLALSGGEDFELCFTVPSGKVETLIGAIEETTGTQATVVGEILPADQGRRLVLPDKQEIPLEPTGWEHFRNSE